MNIDQALEIHFKNLSCFNPYNKEEIEDLKLNFYEIYDEGMFDFEDEWIFMRALDQTSFLTFLSIEAMKNITIRDTCESNNNLTERQIEKIKFTSDYENIARICLNMLDLSRYGIGI